MSKERKTKLASQRSHTKSRKWKAKSALKFDLAKPLRRRERKRFRSLLLQELGNLAATPGLCERNKEKQLHLTNSQQLHPSEFKRAGHSSTMPSAVEIRFASELEKSPSDDFSCLIIGQLSHLRKIKFDDIACKLQPKIDAEVGSLTNNYDIWLIN